MWSVVLAGLEDTLRLVTLLRKLSLPVSRDVNGSDNVCDGRCSPLALDVGDCSKWMGTFALFLLKHGVGGN